MNELLNALTRADRVCKEAYKHYNAASDMQGQCDALEAKSKKSKWKWAGIGFAVYYVGQLLAASVIGIFGSPDSFIVRALAIILGLAVIVLALRVGFGGYKQQKRKTNAEIARRQPQIQREQDAAEQIFEAHANEMDFLPVDYWYPMATDYLVKIVRSQRASDLGTAIDKLEEQMHRWKIEEANAQMVEQQMAQTAHLKSIRRSSKVNAAANVTNTIFNIASKL